MLNVLLAIALGFVLGLTLAAPPGPMNALIAREAGRHGAWAGVRVGMGAPAADVVYLAVLLFGLGQFLDTPGLLRVAAAFGACIMAYFGYNTWYPPRRAGADSAALPPATFWAGFVAALTNPYQVAWWLSGGFVFLQSQGLWGISGLLVGIFGWVVVFAWLVAHGARRYHWFDRAIQLGTGGLLLVFSVLLAAVALAVVRV